MSSMPIPRPRGAAIKDAPDHRDAELVLRLYDLRREATLRESRRYLTGEFWPASAEEATAPLRPDHPANAAFRQVSSYWEMAYAMARHGIINPDYLVESAGEGVYIFAKFHPWLEDIRAASSHRAFFNTEWITKNCDTGKELLERFRKRVEMAIAARRSK